MAQKKENFLKTKVLILIFLSIFSMIFFSSFASIKFVYFAPILIYLFFRMSFISILWMSSFLGLIQDLFSSSFFGINALCYLITSIILYREKRFFNDKPINLSIFAIIFSIIFSIFSPILFFIFDKKINLSIKWLATDLIIYPILDGIYAFTFFAITILLFEKISSLGLKNLWSKYKKIIFLRSR